MRPWRKNEVQKTSPIFGAAYINPSEGVDQFQTPFFVIGSSFFKIS